jgi:hypothetical protein
MRVIRPALPPDGHRRSLLTALAMMLVGGVAGAMLAFVPASSPGAAAVLGMAAALGLGVGGAYLLRAVQHSPQRRLSDAVAALLGGSFDDSYALVVQPRLPEVPRDLAALLVGPAAFRTIVARDWDGHYRVRGRSWEYDARGRRGWIACRTNPSFEAARVNDAVLRWARAADLPSHLQVAPAIVFPMRHSRVLLEEPEDEIVTADNAPWWAQRIGKVQRLDAGEIARVVDAVMNASERTHRQAPDRPPTTVSASR